jgi:hypothetical protein
MSQSEHSYFGQPRYTALRLVSDEQYGRKAAQPTLHPTRLRLGQIAVLWVAQIVLVRKAQLQTRLAGEANR